MAHPAMSEYEARAYERLISPPQDSPSLVPRAVRDTASHVGRAVRKQAATIPGYDIVEESYSRAAQGLMGFTTSNGIRSVTLEDSMKRHRAAGHDVRSAADFR